MEVAMVKLAVIWSFSLESGQFNHHVQTGQNDWKTSWLCYAHVQCELTYNQTVHTHNGHCTWMCHLNISTHTTEPCVLFQSMFFCIIHPNCLMKYLLVSRHRCTANYSCKLVYSFSVSFTPYNYFKHIFDIWHILRCGKQWASCNSFIFSS